MREVDEGSIDRAQRATGLPRSLLVTAVRAYLDGLEARELRTNRRIVRLARMEIGTKIYDYPITERLRDGKHYFYLQSQDIRRARVLMENPDASWTVRKDGGRRVVFRTA